VPFWTFWASFSPSHTPPPPGFSKKYSYEGQDHEAAARALLHHPAEAVLSLRKAVWSPCSQQKNKIGSTALQGWVGELIPFVLLERSFSSSYTRQKGILRDIGIPLLVKRALQKKYERRTFERRNKRMSVLESTRD